MAVLAVCITDFFPISNKLIIETLFFVNSIRWSRNALLFKLVVRINVLSFSINFTKIYFKNYASHSLSTSQKADKEVKEIGVALLKPNACLLKGDMFISFSGNLKCPLPTKSRQGMKRILLSLLRNLPANGKSTHRF